MKKGVLLLIGCIVFAMTMVIAFFGVNPENITTAVYIESLAISAMDGTAIVVNPTSQVKQQKIEFEASMPYIDDEGVTHNAMQYVYNTSISPYEASENAYLYTCDLDDSFVKITNASKGAFLFLEPDYEAEGKDEIYHVIDITCKANDGGPAGVKDSFMLVLHYVK